MPRRRAPAGGPHSAARRGCPIPAPTAPVRPGSPAGPARPRRPASRAASEPEVPAGDDDRRAADLDPLDRLGRALGHRIERGGPAELGALADLDPVAEGD